MEITVDILNKVSAKQARPCVTFQSYFDKWQQSSPVEIVNGNLDNSAHEIWSTIRTILAKLDYPKNRDEAESELAEIVTFLHATFKKAFEETNLRDLLIFLCVYSALTSRVNWGSNNDVTINYFIELNNIHPDKIEMLTGKVFDMVKMFRAQLSAPQNTPYHEKEMFDNYFAGIADGKLMKVYNLIQSMENGRGIMTGNLIEQLYNVLFSLNPEQFANLLRLKSQPVEFISALQWMSKKDLIGLSSYTFSNQWLLFEILRQLSDARQKEEIKYEIKAGAILFAQIYSLSKSFYFQVLNYFKSDLLRNASIGRQLSGMSRVDLSEVITNCFHFKASDSNTAAKNQLLNQFAKRANADQINVFLKLVFDKWLSFMENLEHDQNYYIHELVQTDYLDYIVEFRVRNAEQEPLDKEVEIIVQTIASINEKWFISKSARNNYFFVKLSELYILSCSVRELAVQGISAESDKWNILFNNQIFRSVFLKNDNIQIMNLIKQNFNHLTR